jgi:hypothetical protein
LKTYKNPDENPDLDFKNLNENNSKTKVAKVVKCLLLAKGNIGLEKSLEKLLGSLWILLLCDFYLSTKKLPLRGHDPNFQSRL